MATGGAAVLWALLLVCLVGACGTRGTGLCPSCLGLGSPGVSGRGSG